jgi:hypothetical protein
MDLILLCDLGGGLPHFDLMDHLPLELTAKTTAFESQGACLLAHVQEAYSLSPSGGAAHNPASAKNAVTTYGLQRKRLMASPSSVLPSLLRSYNSKPY